MADEIKLKPKEIYFMIDGQKISFETFQDPQGLFYRYTLNSTRLIQPYARAFCVWLFLQGLCDEIGIDIKQLVNDNVISGTNTLIQ